MKNEMTLSEFMHSHSTAWQDNQQQWWVKIILFTGEPLEIRIKDCDSEYAAKERAFLYLKAKIESKNEETI